MLDRIICFQADYQEAYGSISSIQGDLESLVVPRPMQEIIYKIELYSFVELLSMQETLYKIELAFKIMAASQRYRMAIATLERVQQFYNIIK